MTENLPAIREPAPAAADVDSWVDMMRPAIELAGHVAGTDFVPRGLRDSAPAVAAAILYGREVGLPPMTALNMTHVVEGKPGISAEGMRALVLAAGHDLQVVDTTGAICTMRGRRRGSEAWTSITWTMDMARAAGVARKNVWQSYPRQMLQARCTTELCRLVFPDVIHGFRSIEELEDMRDAEPSAFGAPEAPGTTVARTRRTRKVAASSPPPLEQRGERPVPSGPPLPGEPGYEDSSSGPAVPPVAPEEVKLADEPSDEGAPTGDVEPEGNGSSVGDTDTTPDPGGTGATSEGGGDADPAARGVGRAASPRKASRAQQRMIFAELSEKFGVGSDDREERLYLCGRVLRRQLATFDDLSFTDAKHLIETFGRLADRAALDGLLDTIDQAEEERADVERQDLAGEPEGDGS